jgi:hypothetical protein
MAFQIIQEKNFTKAADIHIAMEQTKKRLEAIFMMQQVCSRAQ